MTKAERLICLDHCKRYAENALRRVKGLTKKKPHEALYHLGDAMMALNTAEHHLQYLEKAERNADDEG